MTDGSTPAPPATAPPEPEVSFETMEAIREANERYADALAHDGIERGCRWFSAGEIGLFDTRVEGGPYGGRYFVSSDQPPDGPRTFNVWRVAGDG